MKIYVLAIFTEGGKEPVNHAIIAPDQRAAQLAVSFDLFPALATCSAFSLSQTAFQSVTSLDHGKDNA